MYEYIKGLVTYVSPHYIVIETSGIGYQVTVGNPFSFPIEEETFVYLYQAVREDAQTLYGFKSLEEKQLFIKLISVSGIGPKSGMAIMALEDHVGLVQAIETEDSKYLMKFPGVGKKTSQQLILDLKGKLGEIELDENEKPVVKEKALEEKESDNPVLAEAFEALRGLGYSPRELKRITPDLEAVEVTTTDGYLRAALKLLMRK